MAAAEAETQGVAPDAAVVACGAVSEAFYYEALARHLGVAFIDGEATLGALHYPQCVHAGIVPFAGDAPLWLVAPRGATLRNLLTRRRAGERMDRIIAITTPNHLSRLAREKCAPTIARRASLGLATLDPALSARGGASWAQIAALVAAMGFGLAFRSAMEGAAFTIATSVLFLAGICLRLLAAAVSGNTGCVRPRAARAVDDRILPAYSVIIALHREARVARELARALEAIDYPRAKLDIKLVIEEGDDDTRAALEALRLPATYEIIVAPRGRPRTKPRALNVALSLVRGEFVAVFDAEDTPAPRQLRDAAERFMREPRSVACLQAQLSIDNVEDSWLTRMFALEYAALFDVTHHGMAELGAPLPLGGSSNHFRVAALREVGGWDAWNVTEDADLGLRLARFGYSSKALASSTEEEAPAELGAWMTQRRRWQKGWMQTFITLGRNPARLLREAGGRGASAMLLLMINMVAAPLLWPPLAGLSAYRLIAFGLPDASAPLDLVAATLWLSVMVYGAASVIWLTLLGMQRRKLVGLWPFLPLLLPYYLPISAASWAALYDLLARPFHWHKTEHGLARSSRRLADELKALSARASQTGAQDGARQDGARQDARLQGEPWQDQLSALYPVTPHREALFPEGPPKGPPHRPGQDRGAARG